MTTRRLNQIFCCIRLLSQLAPNKVTTHKIARPNSSATASTNSKTLSQTTTNSKPSRPKFHPLHAHGPAISLSIRIRTWGISYSIARVPHIHRIPIESNHILRVSVIDRLPIDNGRWMARQRSQVDASKIARRHTG